MSTPLQNLARHGQSAWIDYLSRSFVREGDLAGLVQEGVLGVTSNPTIFQGAIGEGSAYDEQLRDLLTVKQDPKEVFLALAREDIVDACDLLRPVFERGDPTRDGWVSLEVDPNFGYDTEATIGLRAIEEAIASGIPINVTLLFSLQRHREAAEAYLSGLRRLRDAGGALDSVASVASFFVSRVDTEADRRLEEIGGHEELKGTLAIANARLAYQTYKELFSGADWEELERAGASPQRCLWASTSAKNPAYRDVVYVEELIGPQTVNTMPRETIEAFQDHGRVADTLERDIDGARRTLEDFASAGVDYDDVVAVLEREGVEKFANSFKALFDEVAGKRDQLTAA